MGFVTQTSSQASRMHSQLSTLDDTLSKTHGDGFKANFVALPFIKKDVIILLTSQGNSKMPTEGPRQHEKTQRQKRLWCRRRKYSIVY